MTRAAVILAAIAFAASHCAACASPIDGTQIGDWTLASSIRLTGQTHTYMLATQEDARGATSPALEVICKESAFTLDFIDATHPQVPWRGQMFLKTDAGGTVIAEAVAPHPFDTITEIRSAMLTAAALATLAHAGDHITVSFNRPLGSFPFPTRDSTAALRALVGACSGGE